MKETITICKSNSLWFFVTKYLCSCFNPWQGNTLDLILTNGSATIGSYTTHPVLSQSDHHPILVSLKVVTVTTPLIRVRIITLKGTSFYINSLPDTGATEPIISKDLVKTYGVRIDRSKICKSIAAISSCMPCLGSENLKVQVQDGPSISQIQAFVTCTCHYSLPGTISFHLALFLIMSSLRLLIRPKQQQDEDPFTQGLSHHTDKKTHCILNSSRLLRSRRNDIKCQIKSGIIEPVTWPTEWASPAMFLPKPNGHGVRMVADFSALNKFLQRPVHPFPSTTKIAPSIPPDTPIFMTLDAKNELLANYVGR